MGSKSLIKTEKNSDDHTFLYKELILQNVLLRIYGGQWPDSLVLIIIFKLMNNKTLNFIRLSSTTVNIQNMSYLRIHRFLQTKKE